MRLTCQLKTDNKNDSNDNEWEWFQWYKFYFSNISILLYVNILL